MTDQRLLEGLSTLAVSLIVAALWSHNFWRVCRAFTHYRDARSFRSLVLGFLLLLGAWAYVIGSVGAYLIPAVLPFARDVGLVVRGALLVVGVFTFISWRKG